MVTELPGRDDARLIAGYVRHQQRRGLEPTTIALRTRRLSHFARWLGERSLLDATEDDVEVFLDERRGRRTRALAPRSRYGWISNLDCFYDWAIAEGLTSANPTVRIIRPQLPRLLPRPMSDEDLALALRMARSARMRCWLLLAAHAGFRCVEMSRLNREDVLETYRPPILVVRGKKSKERIVPLHPKVEMALRALPMPSNGPVFMHKRTRHPYTPAQISQEVCGFLDDIGVDATTHQGRHWFGTRMYQDTKDLRLVQELLGHSTPATTAIYAAYSQAEAAAAVARLSFEPPIDAALDVPPSNEVVNEENLRP